MELLLKVGLIIYVISLLIICVYVVSTDIRNKTPIYDHDDIRLFIGNIVFTIIPIINTILVYTIIKDYYIENYRG